MPTALNRLCLDHAPALTGSRPRLWRRLARHLQLPWDEAGSDRRDRRPGPRRAVRLACLVLTAATLAACSQTHIHLDRPAPTTTLAPSSSKAVLSTWRHYGAVVGADAAKANPSDPRLAQLATGDELRKVRAFLTELKKKGLRAIGPEDHHPRVTHLGRTTATVADCNFDHTKLVNASGKVVGPPATKAHLLTATLVRTDGGAWKVSQVAGEQPVCKP